MKRHGRQHEGQREVFVSGVSVQLWVWLLDACPRINNTSIMRLSPRLHTRQSASHTLTALQDTMIGTL